MTGCAAPRHDGQDDHNCDQCGASGAIYLDMRLGEYLCGRCEQDAYDDAHDEMLEDEVP